MVSFANAAMLAGLAALAVPVLVHLMKREQARNVVFSTVRFLRRSQLPQAGRRKLRDVPLLLLRLLLFALLVLAFARPLWTPEAKPGAGAAGGAATQVVILDVSASMAADGALESARRKALVPLKEASLETRFGLVLSAAQIVEEHPPDVQRSAIRDAVNRARATRLAGDHRAGLQRAAAMLPADGRGKLVVISDFQNSDWGGLSGVSLPPGTELELTPVQTPEGANWAVLSARAHAAGPNRTVVEATVRSFANADRTLSLELASGGEVVAERAVDVPARGVTTVELVAGQFRSPEAIVRLPRDAYELDNAFHVWLGTRPPPKLLLVAPFADVPDVQTDVFFLRQALGLSRGGGAAYAVEEADAQFLFGLDPAGYSGLLLVRALGTLDREGLETVRGFVSEGGCVVVFPGARAAAGLRSLKEQGLLDVTYRGLAQPTPPMAVNAVSGDPLAQAFGEGQAADLFLTQLHRYARVDAGDEAEVLVATEEGRPVVLRQSTGRGTLIAFTVPPNPEWTDMPLRLSFVPLLHELLQSALPVERAVAQISCGETPVPPPDLLGGQIADPADRPDTSTPGIVKYAGRPVEINVARSESDPTRASLTALRRRLSNQDTGVAGGAPSASPRSAGMPGLVDTPLWAWLAALAAALLLVEAMAAQRVPGEQRAAAKQGGETESG